MLRQRSCVFVDTLAHSLAGNKVGASAHDSTAGDAIAGVASGITGVVVLACVDHD